MSRFDSERQEINTTKNLCLICIRRYFKPNILIGTTEVNENIEVDDDYDYSSSNLLSSATGTPGSRRTSVRTARATGMTSTQNWDGNSHPETCNTSYAHMVIHGRASPTRRTRHRRTGSTTPFECILAPAAPAVATRPTPRTTRARPSDFMAALIDGPATSASVTTTWSTARTSTAPTTSASTRAATTRQRLLVRLRRWLQQAQCASGDIKAQWEGDSFCGISKSVSEAGGSSLRFDDKN